MKLILPALMIFLATGCSHFLLQPADFSWPVEDVLKVDGSGNVKQERYSMNFNVKPLFNREFADSNAAAGKEIRLIRDKSGYYYMTGSGFKNVYRLASAEGGLTEKDVFSIEDSVALASPVLNQKASAIELIDGSRKYILDKNGIARVK